MMATKAAKLKNILADILDEINDGGNDIIVEVNIEAAQQ